jgi:hypothetical protein
MDALVVAAEAPLRLLGQLDLGDQADHCRIPPGELDAGCSTDQTATSVAPDEIFRPQRLAVGDLDVDAGVVLRKTRHLTSTIDRHPQLADPASMRSMWYCHSPSP